MTENLTRAYQKIFAKNAGAQGKTVFGSTAQGNTQYTTDISAMQSEAYENGFANAVVSKKAPVLQDFNTVENITTRQLAYLFQKGIPEWNAETTYFKGNIVLNIESDIPVLYYSLIDNNLNNQVSDTESWKKLEFGNDSNQVVGQIIQVLCTSNYTPFGCLACDGTEYDKTQFNDLWTNYLTAETPLLQTCTYAEYQQDITTYGQCIKFAVDTDNNKFKVPTIKDGSYITQAKSDTELGKSYNESLPNINFELGQLSDRAGYVNVNITTKQEGMGNAGLSGGSQGFTAAFNASDSSSVYQDGAKVQGDNVRARFFIVVANGEINQSVMDWAAWASGLQGKANTDLNNINTAAKETIQSLGMPSNQYIDLSVTSGTNNTGIAPANGYIVLQVENCSHYRVWNETVSSALGIWNCQGSNMNFGSGFIPIAKGQQWGIFTLNGTITIARFYYLAGSSNN